MRKNGQAKEALGDIVNLNLRYAHLHAWPDGDRLAIYNLDVAGANDSGEVKIELENHGRGWEVVNAHMFMAGRRFVILHERGR